MWRRRGERRKGSSGVSGRKNRCVGEKGEVRGGEGKEGGKVLDGYWQGR